MTQEVRLQQIQKSIIGLGVNKLAEEAPEVPASTSKEGVFALEDIDWMTKEQFQAHLDPHQESKSYNTIKAGEEITDGMIHGESGRPYHPKMDRRRW